MLTDTDMIMLIPLALFAMYSTWVTGHVLAAKEDLETEKRCHEMTADRLNKTHRQTRIYRRSLQFYASAENWDPNLTENPPRPSKISSDQGQTAQAALTGGFLPAISMAGKEG